jgi:hypothetical protein
LAKLILGEKAGTASPTASSPAQADTVRQAQKKPVASQRRAFTG